MIPVIKHLDGNCHVYIDGEADLRKAIEIASNAKTRRYGVCNAMETLLVDESVASEVLPEIIARLLEHGVELRGCEATRAFDPQHIRAASEDDDAVLLHVTYGSTPNVRLGDNRH